MFFLSCFLAAGNWPVKENPYANLLTSYLEYYKMIAMTERSQKEKKSYGSLRKGYTSLTVRFFLSYSY